MIQETNIRFWAHFYLDYFFLILSSTDSRIYFKCDFSRLEFDLDEYHGRAQLRDININWLIRILAHYYNDRKIVDTKNEHIGFWTFLQPKLRKPQIFRINKLIRKKNANMNSTSEVFNYQKHDWPKVAVSETLKIQFNHTFFLHFIEKHSHNRTPRTVCSWNAILTHHYNYVTKIRSKTIFHHQITINCWNFAGMFANSLRNIKRNTFKAGETNFQSNITDKRTSTEMKLKISNHTILHFTEHQTPR